MSPTFPIGGPPGFPGVFPAWFSQWYPTGFLDDGPPNYPDRSLQ